MFAFTCYFYATSAFTFYIPHNFFTQNHPEMQGGWMKKIARCVKSERTPSVNIIHCFSSIQIQIL